MVEACMLIIEQFVYCGLSRKNIKNDMCRADSGNKLQNRKGWPY